jgi:hypothetical protein
LKILDNFTTMDPLFDLAVTYCKSNSPTLSKSAYEDFVAAINHCMDNDFNAIINLLYRIDVDEEKIKALPVFDAQHLADLIIARLQKTMATRYDLKK